MVDAMEHRTTDTEMSDVTATPPPPRVPDDNNNNIRELLTLARQLTNQGKPSQALQAVISQLLQLYIYFNFFNSMIKKTSDFFDLLLFSSEGIIIFFFLLYLDVFFFD